MTKLLKRVVTRTKAAKLSRHMDAIWESKVRLLEGVVAGRNLVYANGRMMYVPGISPPNSYGPGDPGNPHAPGPQWPDDSKPVKIPGWQPGAPPAPPIGIPPYAWPGSPGWSFGPPGGGGGTLPPGTGVPVPTTGDGRTEDGTTVIHTFGTTIHNIGTGGVIETVVADLRDGDTIFWLQAADWDDNFSDEYTFDMDGTWSVELDNYDNQPAPWGAEAPATGYKYVAKKLIVAANGEHTLTWTPTANMANATIEHGYVLRGILSTGEGGDAYVGISTAEPAAWPFTVAPGDYGGTYMIGIVGGNVLPTLDETIHTDGDVDFGHTGMRTAGLTLASPATSATGSTFLILFRGPIV